MASRNRVILAIIFFSTIIDGLNFGKATVFDPKNSTTEIIIVPNATIGDPGLSIWPPPIKEKTGSNASDYPLISYKGSNESTCMPLVRSLQTFLNDYKVFDSIPGRRNNVVVCSFDMPPPAGKVCDVDVRHWSPCTEENNFTYNMGSLCIFLRLDTPPGWTPEFYNDTNSLPGGMPSDLTARIASIASQHDNRQRLNTVWVSCEGEAPADKENVGPILYYPDRGIPGYQFSNSDAEGYLSPLVAVRFERPKAGTLIGIECRAWARNIDQNGTALGTAKLALLIE